MRNLNCCLPNYVQSRPTFQIWYCRTRYLYYYIAEIKIEKLKFLAMETYSCVSYTLGVHHALFQTFIARIFVIVMF
jgi:hypothetical protein